MSQWYHISHLSSPAQLGGGAAGCQTHRAGPAHGSSPPHGTHDADKLNSYKTEASGLCLSCLSRALPVIPSFYVASGSRYVVMLTV